MDLGPLGTIDIHMVPHIDFQEKCEDTKRDSTGLRPYVGSSVFTRFVYAYSELLLFGGEDTERNAIELGGGVGLNSLAIYRLGSFKSIICSDGNKQAVEIAKKNIETEESGESTVLKSLELLWDKFEVEAFMSDRDRFDVVFGSELFYYQTDVKGLVQTVLRLVKERGLFLSTHIFRVEGQEEEFIDSLRNIGAWEAYVVPIDSFVSSTELDSNPGWFNCRTLVCGNPAVLAEIVSSGGKQTEGWRPYAEVLEEEAIERANQSSASSFFMNLSNV